jgi:hypothetical protein
VIGASLRAFRGRTAAAADARTMIIERDVLEAGPTPEGVPQGRQLGNGRRPRWLRVCTHRLHPTSSFNPFYVLGNADMLEGAITNLPDNAVKWSPPAGSGTWTTAICCRPEAPGLLTSRRDVRLSFSMSARLRAHRRPYPEPVQLGQRTEIAPRQQ